MATIWERHFSRTDSPDKDSEIPLATLLIGDPFADWLRGDPNRTKPLVFDDILSKVTQDSEFETIIFAIADGSYVQQKPVPEWYNPHVRLLAVVRVVANPKLKFFVVGPLDVKDPERFLQVASWNGRTLNFFAVEAINNDAFKGKSWTFQGVSYDAFSDGSSPDNSYLGPFNGHVNGAAIMKELHSPWIHWLSSKNPEFLDCILPQELEKVKKIPYLLGSDGSPLGGGNYVGTANNLEPIIKSAVQDWYNIRVQLDYCDPVDPSLQTPRIEPLNVHRWMAHLLLTTTVNFAASDDSDGLTYTVPDNHFFNSELLSILSFKDTPLLPDSSTPFKVNTDLYKKACQALQLSILQEVVEGQPPNKDGHCWIPLSKGTLGGGRQTGNYDTVDFVKVKSDGEGVPFTCLQASYEDAQGASYMLRRLQSNGKKFPRGLVSDQMVRALLMIDFANPVYSWRRGVLMQYLPSTTTLTQSPSWPIYDLEGKFVDAVRKSSFASDADTRSPEYQFIQLYDTPPPSFTKLFDNYFAKVRKRLKTDGGVYDYLMLAESRRRIFRPLPLDEFGQQLPYALALPTTWKLVEMTPDGLVVPIPQRGLDFFACWADSLHTLDPHLLPTPDCRDGVMMPRAKASRCPVMMKRRPADTTSFEHAQRDANLAQVSLKATLCKMEQQVKPTLVPLEQNPTWNESIAKLFSEPYWIKEEHRQATGNFWRESMLNYSPPAPQGLHLDLANKASVQYNVVTIYQHLRSHTMPLTNDPSEYWPDEALEGLRVWANQGFRQSASDPVLEQTIIPLSTDPPMKVRKDILSLTPDELRSYRERLDTVLQVGVIDSKWQELAMIHAEWCLHYQQATFFWHRAYLAYVETLIDFPLPYWNHFAADTSDPNSKNAGLPEIFLENTYINSSGELRPNPLKYARAYNGLSKSGVSSYVERWPVLSHGRKPDDPAWVAKVKLFDKYHKQIADAFSKPSFSAAQDYEGLLGLPWANIPVFTDDQDPNLYPDAVKQQFFDGNFELAHDNYHGWIGPDMADNTYTAFDPVFLSYHANMDRIAEMYLRRKPQQQLASTYPLQPFTDNGHAVSYTDPRTYVYTTIGDMAKPSQARGYLYAPPKNPDYVDITSPGLGVRAWMKPTGGSSLLVNHETSKTSEAALTASQASQRMPKVIFAGVTCTNKSYQIDVFVGQGLNRALGSNPDTHSAFIGRMTRLGMGPAGNARGGERCRTAPIVRVLDAAGHGDALRKAQGVTMVVTDLGAGAIVEESEWKGWPGFEAKVVWL